MFEDFFGNLIDQILSWLAQTPLWRQVIVAPLWNSLLFTYELMNGSLVSALIVLALVYALFQIILKAIGRYFLYRIPPTRPTLNSLIVRIETFVSLLLVLTLYGLVRAATMEPDAIDQLQSLTYPLLQETMNWVPLQGHIWGVDLGAIRPFGAGMIYLIFVTCQTLWLRRYGITVSDRYVDDVVRIGQESPEDSKSWQMIGGAQQALPNLVAAAISPLSLLWVLICSGAIRSLFERWRVIRLRRAHQNLVLFQQALNHWHLRQKAEAIDICKRMAVVAPQWAEGYILWGHIILESAQKDEDYKQAGSLFQHALQLQAISHSKSTSQSNDGRDVTLMAALSHYDTQARYAEFLLAQVGSSHEKIRQVFAQATHADTEMNSKFRLDDNSSPPPPLIYIKCKLLEVMTNASSRLGDMISADKCRDRLRQLQQFPAQPIADVFLPTQSAETHVTASLFDSLVALFHQNQRVAVRIAAVTAALIVIGLWDVQRPLTVAEATPLYKQRGLRRNWQNGEFLLRTNRKWVSVKVGESIQTFKYRFSPLRYSARLSNGHRWDTYLASPGFSPSWEGYLIERQGKVVECHSIGRHGFIGGVSVGDPECRIVSVLGAARPKPYGSAMAYIYNSSHYRLIVNTEYRHVSAVHLEKI